MAAIKFPPGTMWWRGGIGLPGFSSAPAEFSPLDLSPALWIDPSDASTVTISGSSGAYIGADGLVCPGAANYAMTPDRAEVDITGDIEIIVKVTAADWTPAARNTIIGKGTSASAAADSYILRVNSSGTLELLLSDGTNYRWATSTVATGLTDGSTKWIKATCDLSNGSNSVFEFYLSDDGTSWTQLGSTVTSTTMASLGNSSAALVIGAYTVSGGFPFVGTIHRAIIKSGIDGTTVFDADFEAATPFVSAFTESAYGAPVYVVSSTATSATANYGYVGPEGFVCGGSGAFTYGAKTTSYAALGVTDLDVIVKAQLPNWAPTGTGGDWAFVLRGSGIAGFVAQLADASGSGKLRLVWKEGGSTRVAISTVATGFAAGTTNWIRYTLDIDNGASGYDVNFYTSPDGVMWTQLGSTVTAAGVTSINNTGDLAVGVDRVVGTVKRAIIKDGIGGTVVYDADFEAAPDYAASFTESSTNAATVTITATNTPANAAGALVSQIDDKSGNARHLTQGTAANMPKYWNGRNGKNVIVFNGSDEHIGAVDWTGLTDNVFTAAFVRVNDTGSSKIIAGFGADLYAMWSSSSELLASYITAGGVTSAGTMNRVIGSSCMTDASASAGRAWVDGTLTTGTTNSAATGGTLRLGQSGSGSLWFSGEVGELLIATTIPDAQQITDTHDYIKAAWGTP